MERVREVIHRPDGRAGRSAVVWLFLTTLLTGLPWFFTGCKEDSGQVSSAAGPGVPVESLKAEMAVPGTIVFQSDLDGDDEIYVLKGRRVEKLTDNTWDDRYPRWSPDGEKIAYTANPQGNFDLFVMDKRGAEIRALTDSPEDELDVAWFPDGKEVAFSVEFKKFMARGRSLWRLDLVTGEKRRLLPGFSGSHQLPDLSPRLSQVAFTGKKGFGWDVFLADLSDQGIHQLTSKGKGCRPRFSPDGRKIVYVSSEADGKGDIWMMGLDGREARRLTDRPNAYDYFPSWSPDGTRVVFCSNFKDKYADKGEWGIFLLDLESGGVKKLFDSPGRDVFPDWH